MVSWKLYYFIKLLLNSKVQKEIVLPWKYGIPGLKKYIINYITRKLLVLSNTSNKVLFRPDAKNKVFHGSTEDVLFY